MSLEQVVTKLLNVKESDLQEVIALEKTGEDLDVKVKLKPNAICGLRRTVLWSKTDAMRSERTDLI